MRFIISMFYNVIMSSLLGGLSVAVMGGWGVVFALIFNFLFVWLPLQEFGQTIV